MGDKSRGGRSGKGKAHGEDGAMSTGSMMAHPRNAARTPTQPPAWTAYAFALVVTGATLLLRMALGAWIGDRPVLILFLVPIILGAYVGGLGPGLVSTALAGLGTALFFIPPTFTFAFARAVDFAQWSLLILATVVRILHRHGGTIRATGMPGKGARFCFTLAETQALHQDTD